MIFLHIYPIATLVICFGYRLCHCHSALISPAIFFSCKAIHCICIYCIDFFFLFLFICHLLCAQFTQFEFIHFRQAILIRKTAVSGDSFFDCIQLSFFFAQLDSCAHVSMCLTFCILFVVWDELCMLDCWCHLIISVAEKREPKINGRTE